MDPIVKKIIFAVLIVICVIVLIFLIGKLNNKKDDSKPADNNKVVEPEYDPEPDPEEKNNQKQELTDDAIKVEQEKIERTIKCTYEGKGDNVIWEKSYVIFNLDEENKVVRREDVREYKFDKVNIDDQINNKTLLVISNTLNNITGISSTLSTIDEAEHTYRFTTIFSFDNIDLDQLYETYYKVYFTDDLEMTREQFDSRYKDRSFGGMSIAYVDEGYKCS